MTLLCGWCDDLGGVGRLCSGPVLAKEGQSRGAVALHFDKHSDTLLLRLKSRN